jgi:thiol-disulfide isomerase/thioredoxin
VRFFQNLLITGALATTSVGLLAQPSLGAELLTIGSSAPTLDVEHWVQDGGGKFKPVTKFEAGKIYVVEFWATWCGPCVASMPHLADLQQKLADKGVRIVSISDEDLETVEKFLDREVRKGPEDQTSETKTYRQLTSAYSLTTDPDQSSYRDYMEAAEQNGIPTAFIVGKDAKIEWIGHPMEMDGPLGAVIAGNWDREAFAKEVKAQREAEKAMQEIFALLQKQDFDGAIALIDQASADKPDDMQLNMLKLQVLIVGGKSDAANTHLQSLYKKLADVPEAANMVAWNIYEMAAQGRIEKGSLIDSSIAAAEASLAKTKGEEKASVLDTLAHLYAFNDNLDKAIELESEALKLSGDRDREFIQGYLKELEELKQKASQK